MLTFSFTSVEDAAEGGRGQSCSGGEMTYKMSSGIRVVGRSTLPRHTAEVPLTVNQRCTGVVS
jgi:hypothetical protein